LSSSEFGTCSCHARVCSIDARLLLGDDDIGHLILGMSAEMSKSDCADETQHARERRAAHEFDPLSTASRECVPSCASAAARTRFDAVLFDP
jgi:hypothetical protein